jgi:hypothetical protein
MIASSALGDKRRASWLAGIIAVAATVTFCGRSCAVVVNLEDLPLAPDSYWNGSDGSGGFTSCDTFFNNSYNSFYGSWSGWAYSNVQDTTTPGYTNQYAAYPGSGADGSSNYAVAFGCSSCSPFFTGPTVLATITIPDGRYAQSAMFANTTYAALSMLYGDEFAEPFGVDDWFKVTITGKSASGRTLANIDFYLAQNGSIVADWTQVDLGPLCGAKTLEFDFTSTDNGLWGMNTPAYVALDDLTLPRILPGDFNLDGQVNLVDLLVWKTNVGLASGATFILGDANDDGAVDEQDMNIWAAHAGKTVDDLPPLAGGAAAPEPSAFVLLLWAGIAGASWRRRRRSRRCEAVSKAPRPTGE